MVHRGKVLLAALIGALGVGGAAAQTAPAHPLGWITLGTQGGPAPTGERSEPANILLVEDRPWIVDRGDGAMERFAAAGFAPPQATTVFISHLHVDHIGGLQGLIALHWFRGGPGDAPLTVNGPPGTDKVVDGVVLSLAMHANPGARWTLPDLASRAGMSRAAFTRAFKATVGSSPIDYLTRWRMLLAGARLADGDQPVSIIAASLGYESDSAFSTAFKRVMGCAPRRYARAGSPEPSHHPWETTATARLTA